MTVQAIRTKARPDTRVEESRNIALTVNTAERSINAAIRDSALAIASLMDASNNVGVAAEVGHDAVTTMLGSVNALVDSRGRFVEAHKQLAAVGRSMGLTVTDWGDAGRKPGDKAFSMPRGLASVA